MLLGRARTIAIPLLLLIVLCACEAGSRGSEPMPECSAYAASAQLCFGPRVAERLRASFAKAPEGAAARAALRTQCTERSETLRRSCR